MIAPKTYTNIYGQGETLPIPALEDLRAFGDGDGLPQDRDGAAETWWLYADHPGFGLDAQHTAAAMRDAGFAEPDIRTVLLALIDGCPADQGAARTDFLVQLVHRLEGAE